MKKEAPKIASKFYILNIADSGEGSHWVMVYNLGKICYYFDSFGLMPPETIVTWMKKSKKQIQLNDLQIQDPASQMCGFFCMFVADGLDSGRTFNDIIHSFDPVNLKLNDAFLKLYFTKGVMKMTGKGLLNNILNSKFLEGSEMHMADPINGKYHFLGPFTRYDERVNGEFGKTKDSRGRLNSEPINDLDRSAMIHDKEYEATDVETRLKADTKLMNSAQAIYKNSQLDKTQRATAFLIYGIFKLKTKLGMGIQ